MKTGLMITCTGIILLMNGSIYAKERITVHPKDTEEALINPSMGWTLHFYSNIPSTYGSRLAPSDTVDDFPGLTTVYLRIPWAHIEPEEGQFNWAMLDTPAQRWIAKGKRVALRLTCSESWLKYATPEWVKNAGAKGTFYKINQGPVEESNLWDPYFDDPVFLEKLDNFLSAAAARYDGNPNIEFIDVGTFGLWGEGHTFMSSIQKKPGLQKIHIDLHLKHFTKTQLCISDDFAGWDKPGRRFPITDYALSKGITLRDDTIMVHPAPRAWFHDEMAQEFWPKLPVILEHDHYGATKVNKSWDPKLLLKAVEDYHASFMSIHWWPREFLTENREVIDRINLRMGYRLHPTKITWPKTVQIGKRFNVQWTWLNKGVAPFYSGGYPTLTLKNAEGGIVSVLSNETLNLRSLKVGPPTEAPEFKHESQFAIGLVAPTTKPGTYDLFLSVGSRDGTPEIALPLSGSDGQRRYRLGTITVEKVGES